MYVTEANFLLSYIIINSYEIFNHGHFEFFIIIKTSCFTLMIS